MPPVVWGAVLELAILGAVYLVITVAYNFIEGEWLWQASAKSKRKSKSFPSKLPSSQQLSLYARTLPTANSSRQANVCSCPGCRIGGTCYSILAKYLSPPMRHYVGVSEEGFVRPVEKKPDLEKVHGAVRMFRVWKMTNAGELKACVADFVWSKGENASLVRSAGIHHRAGW